ncbi:uncharacterized protein LY89DRAFT_679257 [Mollisia scopiformis]|uniref:Uncharacterized protein n=1 Tax=Mollisia scopiformis TaxID=149040 RepID=A0A194XUV8_MOLSC|nr:uncharacterized protein LY89DRAFT_679257 [Mollisia scopiformis]KUJ23993.1 hypothetical protein LY89DRAFT_679257 [Mollisia scopiformis]
MSPSNENQSTTPQANLQTTPPTTPQSMTLNPSQSTTPAQAKESQDQEMRIRGGDRGGMCPGRFCFIIPCPLPCDCCII